MLGRNEAATILFRLQEIGICSVEDTRKPQFPFHRSFRHGLVGLRFSGRAGSPVTLARVTELKNILQLTHLLFPLFATAHYLPFYHFFFVVMTKYC